MAVSNTATHVRSLDIPHLVSVSPFSPATRPSSYQPCNEAAAIGPDCREEGNSSLGETSCLLN